MQLPSFTGTDKDVISIAEKVFSAKRISPEEGLLLYEKAPIGILSFLAESVCKKLNGDKVYFIRNFHIEPTNICAYHCRFCSYSQKSNEDGAWELSKDEINQRIVESDPLASEIHITGGAHPDKNTAYYLWLIKTVRLLRPNIHIKAFSAVEIHHMHKTSDDSYDKILKSLIDTGLDSLPGGGAEIFDPKIREQICPEKANTENWLAIHETAHQLGIHSNATMLYGHIENYIHRIDHMERLRKLQDKTNGFKAFIPLKFRNRNNRMSEIPETTLIEDLRNYAVSRIFLDNFPHVKAYWPMLGKKNAQLSLFFGVDDLDGTIQDSTQVYTLAGLEEKPSLSASEITELIILTGKEPVERDALYNPLNR
jgi:aminodeoxyfutalosine synthase